MQDHTTRAARPAITPIDRFWNYVTLGPFTDCWEWTGALRNGYGVLNVGGKVVYAHRFSYELHYGPLPDGLCVLHNCPGGDNARCCNPYHLYAGTKADNNRDTYAKGRGNTANHTGMRKLTADDVRHIRQQAAQGMHYPALAAQYGVTISNISMIVAGKRWKRVK